MSVKILNYSTRSVPPRVRAPDRFSKNRSWVDSMAVAEEFAASLATLELEGINGGRPVPALVMAYPIIGDNHRVGVHKVQPWRFGIRLAGLPPDVTLGHARGCVDVRAVEELAQVAMNAMSAAAIDMEFPRVFAVQRTRVCHG